VPSAGAGAAVGVVDVVDVRKGWSAVTVASAGVVEVMGLGKESGTSRQGFTLVHLSAQPKPVMTQNTL